MPTAIPANRAPLDARSVAEVTGGRVVRLGAARQAVGVVTDSRAVTAGCAFVALQGARHDGHSYVEAAIEAGAVLVVVARGRATETDRADVVEVDDTLSAWGALARAHVRSWRAAHPDRRVVAITGSAGKTTTKELCAALLNGSSECHATHGNLNNRVGVPAVALQLDARHRYAVFELGMSIKGEIATLASIVEPDVAVITNVALAHAAGVGGCLSDVGREKGALFAALRPGGVAVANGDDPVVMGQLVRANSARSVTFGAAVGLDYALAERLALGAEGSRAVVVRRLGTAARDGDSFVVRVPIPGHAAALDFLAALAAAEAAVGDRLAYDAIAWSLQSLPPLDGRMRPRRLGHDILVLDDAYNANPASMRAALQTLAELGGGRRVAVLGEMKELGACAEEEHEALAAAVASAGVALLISCGGLSDTIARAAQRGTEVVMAPNAEGAARAAIERVRSGDIVLVKASRSVGADRVVEALARKHGQPAEGSG
ncbi:MAG: UDP-N-acetylmuramoyl-tripeptide--D-alanyl-D-alanine ligase [Myxococcota bacterium]|nr:UDP-N-acetylmuramoyl-tripeptide--D-alanyl-D-alanine ligase [Myxococcota bacterium]